MREITLKEMTLVSGAGSQEVVAGSTAIGSAIGASSGSGIATAEALAITGGRAALGGVAGAGVGTAAVAGWEIGQWINENTPVQEWIADGIDKLTQDGNGYTDPSGSNY